MQLCSLHNILFVYRIRTSDSCRLMLGFGILPSVAMFISMCFLAETPRWLVFHGKTEKAQDVLKKIRHSKDVENELNNIVKEYNKSQKDRIGKIEKGNYMNRFYRTKI